MSFCTSLSIHSKNTCSKSQLIFIFHLYSFGWLAKLCISLPTYISALIPFLIYSFSPFVWSIFLYSGFDIQNFLSWIFEKFSISIFFIFLFIFLTSCVCVCCMCPWLCVCMQDSVLMCPCSGVSFGGFYLSHFLSTLHIEVEAPKLASEILVNLAIHLIPFNLPG